ncbi:MAG: hypothetical protein JWR63_3007, partial [Conexibacter sp.]|nr:hypothetical protein [Conexibacter sp.]
MESGPKVRLTLLCEEPPMHGTALVADIRPIPPAPERAPLWGRDAELDRVGELIAALATGAGGVLLVDGPAGIGKSRLLREAMAVAARNRVRVARGRPPSASASVTFGPLLAALFEGPHPLFDGNVLRDLSTAPDRGYWLVQELQGLVRRAAREQPLLIVLDDLQWADAETFAALGTLVAGLAGTPVAWLLAARLEEAPAEPRAALDRLAPDGGRHLRLGALDAA